MPPDLAQLRLFLAIKFLLEPMYQVAQWKLLSCSHQGQSIPYGALLTVFSNATGQWERLCRAGLRA